MVQKLFEPEERAEVRQQLHSELRAISEKYGIELGRKESEKIVNVALNNLKKTTPLEVRERIETALLDHLRKIDHERANVFYNQMEGKKYWEHLGLENIKVSIGTKEMAVADALRACNKLDGEKKAEYFRDIVSEMAEKFRTRSDMQNSLGIRYSVESTDPAEALTHKAFNCFSGSIILGQLIIYAAGRVGLESEVSARVQQVASYTLGGKWDDAGHAIVRVDFYGISDEKKRTVFFDPMNTIVARHEQSLVFDPRTEMLSSSLLAAIHYRLGKVLDITPGLVETAKFQDKLFDMQSLDRKTITRMARMPPLFLSYFVNHMSVGQQREFFKNFDADMIAKIDSPALKYRLAATAASAFADKNRVLASKFGALALSSLKQAIAAERAMLPLGASLDNTINLVSLMEKTPNGKRIIADSGIWAYLPYVSSTSIAEITPDSARKARDFLINFYQKNPSFLASFTKKNPIILVNYAQGLLTMSLKGGYTIQGEEVLNGVYNLLGIDRGILIQTLRANARSVAPMGMSKKQIEDFLSREKNMDYLLERNFLIVAAEILRGTFSLEVARRMVIGYTGPTAIIGHAILATLKKESFEKILLAQGPLKAAAQKKGLV